MPGFAKRENIYIGTLQSGGGRDAYLEFELTELPHAEPEMYAKAPIPLGTGEGVLELEIKKAAMRGLARANRDFETSFSLKRIGYVPNDSSDYDLHERIVWEVIRHLKNGGEFKAL